ncbi:hypothetical protein Ga0466249_004329 [Sporomusaceae bacterium BoRhaA]|uniref:hypothetical protein n=1 Tax=Pelorhabdus rhamnosifermentans TaxID=2772457 RepID=UPI001C0642C5|nr:hypothetical protein [Pelorhabdus rhamnosifermentans]MBU2703193.1 hypothetical protein [Pelorhabdus rhamnosifermentans]
MANATERDYLEYYSKLWDAGFNSKDKLSKLTDIAIKYKDDIEKIIEETQLLLDGAEPELPYNPYTMVLQRMDYNDFMQIVEQNRIPQDKERTILTILANSSFAKKNPVTGITYAFIYGIICGKRAERSRKVKS